MERMFASLRGRMGLLLLAFFLLVSISVAMTFWTIETLKNDALVINLAGRQRLLIKQMTDDVLRLANREGVDHLAALEEVSGTFDRTLKALRYGGLAPYGGDRTVYVPVTRQVNIQAGLRQVDDAWKTMRAAIERVSRREPDRVAFTAAVQSVKRLSPELLRRADGVVRLYEVAARRKVTRLWRTQMAFFVSAIVLLATGVLVTRVSVVRPLHLLGAAANRIGQGDLETCVEVTGPLELAKLAGNFDTMRQRLGASQRQLLAWTETLEARVAQRTRELAALHQISREISSRLNLDHVLHSVTDKARELLDGDVACLCLLDGQSRALHLRVVSGPQEAVRKSCVPVQQPLPAQVLAEHRALSCDIEHCLGACGIMTAPFQTSHLAAPLQVDGRTIGAVCVASPHPGRFADDKLDLLTKLTDSAAVALENAHLYEQAERVATLEERQRIAAEMHDGLAQTLSYLGLKAQQMEERLQAGERAQAMQALHSMQVGIKQALRDVRRSIASLEEGPQPRRALQDRLMATIEEVNRNNGVSVELQSQPQTPLYLPPTETEQVVHVVREALLNACRHAQAKWSRVQVQQQQTEIWVCVEDDGKGFDPQALPAQGGKHFGLRVMRARAARLGGQLSIDSAPGQGTRVILRWSPQQSPAGPMSPAASDAASTA